MDQLCDLIRHFIRFSSIVLFLVHLVAVKPNAIEERRKPYNDNLTLECPGCTSSDDCTVTINNASYVITEAYTIVNDDIVLLANDRDVYGTVCCRGNGFDQMCYQVCPSYNETCEHCLGISINVSAVAVGGTVAITCSMEQIPHNGLSLLVNGSIGINPGFSCRTMSNVLGHQVVYHCIAKKSGPVTIQANTEFCGEMLYSQQFSITVAEPQAEQKSTNHVHSTQNEQETTTAAVTTTTPSPTITTTAVSMIKASITPSAISTTPTDPDDHGNATTGVNVGQIIGIVTAVLILLILVVVVVILIRICGKRKWCTKQQNVPDAQMIDHQPTTIPVQVTESNSISDNGYASNDTGSSNYSDSYPASEHTSRTFYQPIESDVVQTDTLV